MSSSHLSTTVNQHMNLTDTDLTALFVSSLVATTSNDSIDNINNNNNNNTLDDAFLSQFSDFVYSPSSMIDQQSFGPPPGFEHFRFDSSNSADSSLNPSINQTNTPVSSSDTINFSQLLSANIADSQQQQQSSTMVGKARSSLTSDEQSIFAPIYSPSSYATSQIYSPNPTSSSTMTARNSTTKSHLSNGLSFNNHHYSTSSSSSLLPNSTTDSPIENEKRITDGIIPTSHIFSSNNSFFTNGRTDFPSSKSLSNQVFSSTARTSSSASSTSSIDDALIQLNQQQQQTGNLSKLFNDQSASLFTFSSLPSKPTADHQQEQALQDNINLLASMTAASTPGTPQRSANQSQQQPSTRNRSINMKEFVQNINELCDKGFDELNALIQEQRWVQNYVNGSLISSPTSSPSTHASSCSSRILIVCEYFIFKCKKAEITASEIFEFLAMSKAELRLRDLMFVFKSWKDSINNAEQIHQEEETKLRLTTEHPQSYFITESVLQSAFERISTAIRQLCHVTQQVRAAFQYATWNVFQTSSRQPIQSQPSISAQFHAMQPQQPQQHEKSSSSPRSNGSIRTTP